MRIAVNTRLLLNGKLEGIGWFTYQTLERIVRDHPEHDFFFSFLTGLMILNLFSPLMSLPVIVHPAGPGIPYSFIYGLNGLYLMYYANIR